MEGKRRPIHTRAVSTQFEVILCIFFRQWDTLFLSGQDPKKQQLFSLFLNLWWKILAGNAPHELGHFHQPEIRTTSVAVPPPMWFQPLPTECGEWRTPKLSACKECEVAKLGHVQEHISISYHRYMILVGRAASATVVLTSCQRDLKRFMLSEVLRGTETGSLEGFLSDLYLAVSQN